MTEKQKQIVEMAKDICRVKLNCNDVCNPVSACDALKYAERAVEAGYKKQSEVAREIFEEIERRSFYGGFSGDRPNLTIMTTKDFEELKKKYMEDAGK